MYVNADSGSFLIFEQCEHLIKSEFKNTYAIISDVMNFNMLGKTILQITNNGIQMHVYSLSY